MRPNQLRTAACNRGVAQCDDTFHPRQGRTKARVNPDSEPQILRPHAFTVYVEDVGVAPHIGITVGCAYFRTNTGLPAGIVTAVQSHCSVLRVLLYCVGGSKRRTSSTAAGILLRSACSLTAQGAARTAPPYSPREAGDSYRARTTQDQGELSNLRIVQTGQFTVLTPHPGGHEAYSIMSLRGHALRRSFTTW